MKGVARGFRFILATAVAFAGTGVARAEDASSNVTDADRVYRNFTREAATVQPGQVRLEVRGMSLENTGDVDVDLNGFPVREHTKRIEGGIFDFLTSYGLGSAGEVGAVVPVFTQSTRVNTGLVDTKGNAITKTTSDTDIGDVQLYTKFKRPVAEHCSIAGGVELSLPTGIEHKTFGTGEMGVNPFVATRYQNGRVGFGLHAGYEIYTGDVQDVFNYSAELILRANSMYNIHVELAGRHFDHSGSSSYEDVSLLPGIDFNLSPNWTLRPTGLVGLTDKSPDWGIGVGIAYTFALPTMAVAAAAPPPPPPPAAAPAAAPAPVKKKIVLRGVNFDFDKANIRKDAAPVLDEAVSTLKEYSSLSISVEGHTDSKGSHEYNEVLSRRRAQAVSDYLAAHGIDKSRMTVEGFGKTKPVASNETEEGRAQNRRVELHVTSE